MVEVGISQANRSEVLVDVLVEQCVDVDALSILLVTNASRTRNPYTQRPTLTAATAGSIHRGKDSFLKLEMPGTLWQT